MSQQGVHLFTEVALEHWIVGFFHERIPKFLQELIEDWMFGLWDLNASKNLA
jgi:hypothetical protein